MLHEVIKAYFGGYIILVNVIKQCKSTPFEVIKSLCEFHSPMFLHSDSACSNICNIYTTIFRVNSKREIA
jgi:hypothetical protein